MDNAPNAPRVPPGTELRQVLAVLKKWRGLIAVVVLAAVAAAAYLYRYGEPKVYVATATLNVTQAGQSPTQSGNLQGVVQNVSSLPATLQTYLWQVTDPAVLQDAANALNGQGVGLTAADLRTMVHASLTPGTNLIEVNASAASAKQAATVADAVASAYLQVIAKQDSAKLSQAVGLLQQQAQSVADQLSKATSDLAQTEAKAGVTSDTQARISADNQQVSALHSQLVQARVALSSDEAGLRSVQSQLAATPPTVTDVATQSAVSAQATPNPLYTSLQSQLRAAQVKVAGDKATVDQLKTTIQSLGSNAYTLSQAGGDQELTNLNNQLVQAKVALSAEEAAESNLKDQLSKVPATLAPPPRTGPVTVANPAYQALQAKASSLQTVVAQDQASVYELSHALSGAQADAATLPQPSAATEAKIQTLQTQIDQLTKTYKTLSAGLTQSQITNLVLQGNAVVTLAAPAVPPTLPVHKSSKKLVALALAGGLIVAVGLVLLLEQLDATVRTPEDIERLTALPTLGIIPHAGR